MAQQTTLLITHGGEASATISELLSVADSSNKGREINLIQDYLNALAGGAREASIKVGVNAVKASGTVTFSGVGQATDTILINGVTFTAVASGATGDQWNVGGTATLSGAALAAAINASVTALVANYVTAASVAGVVTITAVRPGIFGNTVTIAEGLDGLSAMAVSGARLTGGTQGTEVTYTYGSPLA